MCASLQDQPVSPYAEPSAAFGGLRFQRQDKDAAVFRGEEGVDIEVSHLEGIGWCLEARYDLADGVTRQPETGVQGSLRRSPLERDGLLVRAASGETCELTTDARLTLAASGHDYLVCKTPAFSTHRAPISLYESMMSLKVTSFKDRAPFVAHGTLYETRMTRFQYARPEGVVLGLPGQSGEMNRNGYRFELYNTDEYLHLPSRRPLYQAWPILFHRSGDGWVCVFHDNPSRSYVDVGDFYPEHVTFESVTGNTRVYVLHGASLEEVSRKLSQLLGEPLFPPAWAFGYQQCRWSYMDSREVRQVAGQLRKRGIPCDALYLDIDYMDGFRVFTKDETRFGDLRACVDDLKTEGMRTVCIIDPGVKLDPGYEIYKQLIASGGFLKAPDGQPLVIVCWPGKTVLPDFGDPAVRAWWAALQAAFQQEYGIDGVWNDMNEPSNFDGGNGKVATASTARGSIKDEYNMYGYWMTMASAAGCEAAAPGKRSLAITRSGYPGVQRYAVGWHGDNQAWWEHLSWALEAAIGYALAGSPYSGADVPGFTGNPPDDLAVRFFQLGTLLPLYRGHSIYFSKDKEPYAFGRRANTLIKRAILLRYSLLREWYSGFERCRRERVPLMEPVFTQDGNLARDQVLLFGKFLAAPIVERDQERRSIYLPAGDWYALGKKRRIKGDRWITVRVTDASMPLYVRAGSVVVRNEPGRNAEETLAAPETYEAYPAADGSASGYWYGDDGETKDDPRATRRTLILKANGEVESASLR